LTYPIRVNELGSLLLARSLVGEALNPLLPVDDGGLKTENPDADAVARAEAELEESIIFQN
jgi:hypothetical protein